MPANLQFGAKRLHDVVPEFFDVAVGVRSYHGIPAAEMQRAGAGNRDLRQGSGVPFEEVEIGGMDGFAPAQLASDRRNRLRAPAAGTGLGGESMVTAILILRSG